MTPAPTLAKVDAPTLVVHRRDDSVIEIGHARYLADHIAGATLHELDGDDHLFFAGDQTEQLRVLLQFLDELNCVRPLRPAGGWAALTEAESGIAQLIALGMSNKQIATKRSISTYTVDTHLRGVFRKMKVHNRTDLVRQMLANHLA